MNITLNLSPEQEIQLQDSLRRRDRNQVRQILKDAIEPTIDSLIETNGRLSIREFERLATELVNQVETATKGETPILRDEDIKKSGFPYSPNVPKNPTKSQTFYPGPANV